MAIFGARRPFLASVTVNKDIELAKAIYIEQLESRRVLTSVLFQSHPILPEVGDTEAYVLQDLNLDGHLDVAAFSRTTGEFRFYDTQGQYPLLQVDSGTNAFLGGLFVDVDGNGVLDVIAKASLAGTNDPNSEFEDLVWVKDFDLFDDEPRINFLVEDVAEGWDDLQIEALDIDGDSDVDILTQAGDDSWQWFENLGLGDFADARSNALPSSFDRFWDFDGDGDLDAVGIDVTTGQLEVAENTAGVFSASTAIVDDDNATIAAADYGDFHFADVDGNGSGDFLATGVAGNGATHLVYQFIQQSDGRFARSMIYEAWVSPSVSATTRIAAQDSDGDNDLDVLVVQEEIFSGVSETAEILWLQNEGTEFVQQETVYEKFDRQVVDIRFADTDLDGQDEAIVATTSVKINAYGNADELLAIQLNPDSFPTMRQLIQPQLSLVDSVPMDVDGDGDMDIVGAAHHENNVAGRLSSGPLGSVYWAENLDGQGTFSALKVIWRFGETLVNGANISSLRAGDLDNDGAQDILIVREFTDEVLWLRNLGAAGEFGEPQLVTDSQFGPTAAVIGDLDDDGDNDIVAIAKQDGSLTWYRNKDADDGFSSPRVIWDRDDWTDFFYDVRVGDVDGDSSLDIVAAGTDGLFVFLNTNGRGQFGEPIVISDKEVELALVRSSFTLGDVDSDGDFDIIISGQTNGLFQVNVLESLGAGAFAAPRPVADSATAIWGGDLEITDVDLDGRPDIVVGFTVLVGMGPGGIGWFRQLPETGGPTFESMEVIGQHARGVVPPSVVAADFDGDMGPDFLMTDVRGSVNGVVDNRGYGLRWYSSALETNQWHNFSMPFDVNGDGQVTPTDAIAVINELNDREFTLPSGTLNDAPRPDSAGFLDVDNNAFVTPADAIQVINALNSDDGSIRRNAGGSAGRKGIPVVISTRSFINEGDEEARDAWFAGLWSDLSRER